MNSAVNGDYVGSKPTLAAKFMTIYKVTNKLNNKCYIGQTNRTIEERWKEHCKVALKTRSYLSNAIQKYGKENFIIEELCKANTQEELDKLEVKLVTEHNAFYPKGYNLKAGGLGGKLSEETKEKLRKINLGRKASEKVKLALKKARIGKSPINIRPVIGTNIETGETIYLNHANADKRFHYNCIHRCAKGERKSHMGYTWRYTLPNGF